NREDLWRITRKWSLEYFDLLYKIFGTKFDRLFFESEVYEKGKEIIESHTDGIFKKDKGAIIFEGEKYGLHNRVFLTSEGYATYEGKEMALAILQYKTFPFDLALHVVAAEQEAYFKVVFKALELIDSKFKDREKHLSYGMVELKEGKMSSRAGNVVTALWLFEEAEKRIKKHFPNTDAKNVQQIAVGAVKYSLLKFSRTSNISFSFEESISLEGNSGPYLQYTFTRSQSIKRKAEELGIEPLFSSQKYLTEGEVVLLRYLSKFQDAVEESAKAFAPNILCNYLYELAQKYNIFYQKVPVLTSESKEFRLALNNAAGETIKKGLSLLGIAVPERM
ncbi:arginine--tRNA ligase, partial [Patescibacteria group bacterium]|nr:arginine--tRNA ligase [Patescibacteria group bacterium]